MKIAFHTEQIDVRGTCVAIYDYAYYNETILNNESIIIWNKNNEYKNDLLAVKKFLNRFRVFFYETISELQNLLDIENVSVFYAIKYGKRDELCKLKRVKIIIHCVFDMSEPHGDVYLAVSESLAQKYGKVDFLPHMIGLKPSYSKENLRKVLNIPNEATVFGRHGGIDTFDLPFAIPVIIDIAKRRKDIYFVFMNMKKFVDSSQVIFLNGVVDENEKNRFINTCDVHLECGTIGQSFGLSIGEFSVNNKPIIAYKPKNKLWNTEHFKILGDKGIYFETKEEFLKILENFKKQENENWNCYKQFSPEIVMNKFRIILDRINGYI